MAVVFVLGLATLLSVAGVLGYLSFMTAKGSGWSDLADERPAPADFEGVDAGLRSAIFNGYAFTKTLVVRFDETGLYLRPILILQAFHTPLLLPWEELVSERTARRGEQGLRIARPDGPEFALELEESTRARLAALLPEDWAEARRILDPESAR